MKAFLKNYGAGFTIPEIIVTLAIVATLFGIVTITLVHSNRRASLNTTVSVLVSDLGQQQIKAMNGDTEGRVIADSYGIYFNDTKYTLFHGASYNSSDTDNFVVNLDNGLHFPSPAFSVIFAKGSGEIGSPATITLQDTTNNDQKMLQLNKYGVVATEN